ncbi:MAG: DUF3341 domain-containing protein [Halofilum sp. (in: g-proteobacteria)]
MASVIGRFDHPAALIAAAREAHAQGYRGLDAYTPFPLEELTEAIGFHERRIPVIALIAGIVGAGFTFWLQWYSAHLYPFVVGGKPLGSWPAFMLATVAVCILAAVLAAFVAMLAGNRLPQPYHPAFDWPAFDRASSDGFFLLIDDPEIGDARAFLEARAREVQELPP